MACVYLLGPNTNFGMSEQNPAFWIQLLLSSKQTGIKSTWYDPVRDRTYNRLLRRGDWIIWIRFLMSFLINGVGFHILVHALPIQVAGQSSLFGVVFRAVGMMYLVDLDDTPGYKITLIPKDDKEIQNTNTMLYTEESESDDHYQQEQHYSDGYGDNLDKEEEKVDDEELQIMTQRILDEAQTQLNELGMRKRAKSSVNKTNYFAAGAPQTTTRDIEADGEGNGGGGEDRAI